MVKFTTKDIDERNKLITDLYGKGVKYTYTDKDNEGNYHVDYEEKE